MRSLLAIFSLSVVIQNALFASAWTISESQKVVGKNYYVQAEAGETLSDIALRYSMGIEEMKRANPRIDVNYPMPSYQKVLIPAKFILPDTKREGIVINLPEYRLYYFSENGTKVMTMPVGIGRDGWNTPIGVTRITALSESPVWRPTPSVRLEAAKNGTPIPNRFPPGMENPLGQYVLRLGWPTYLLHGTNRPEGVGAKVSAGCIRMLPKDIAFLFQHVQVGSRVEVLHQSIKLAEKNGRVYLQSLVPVQGMTVESGIEELRNRNPSLTLSKKILSIIQAQDGRIRTIKVS